MFGRREIFCQLFEAMCENIKAASKSFMQASLMHSIVALNLPMSADLLCRLKDRVRYDYKTWHSSQLLMPTIRLLLSMK
jgi:hypothetical protein